MNERRWPERKDTAERAGSSASVLLSCERHNTRASRAITRADILVSPRRDVERPFLYANHSLRVDGDKIKKEREGVGKKRTKEISTTGPRYREVLFIRAPKTRILFLPTCTVRSGEPEVVQGALMSAVTHDSHLQDCLYISWHPTMTVLLYWFIGVQVSVCRCM